MTRPYADPGRGLLLSVDLNVFEVVFYVLKHDPGKRFARGTQQWARENKLEDWAGLHDTEAK